MALDDHDLPDLRAAVPTLEPDEAFLQRLAAVAAGSAAGGPPAGVIPGSGWRVALAAASVVVVAGGAAALAGSVGDDVPAPPNPPATRPSDLGPTGTRTESGETPGADTSPEVDISPGLGEWATGLPAGRHPEGADDLHDGLGEASPHGDDANAPVQPSAGRSEDRGIGTGPDNPGRGDDRGSGRNDRERAADLDARPRGEGRFDGARGRLR